MAEKIIYKNDFMHVSAEHKDLLLDVKVIFDRNIEDSDVTGELMNNIGGFFKDNFFSDDRKKEYFNSLLSSEYFRRVGDSDGHWRNFTIDWGKCFEKSFKQINERDQIEIQIEYSQESGNHFEGKFSANLLINGVEKASLCNSVSSKNNAIVKKMLNEYYSCLSTSGFFAKHFDDIRLPVSLEGLKAEAKTLKLSKDCRALCCLFRCEDGKMPKDDKALEVWRKRIAYTFAEILENFQPFGTDNLLGMVEDSSKAEDFVADKIMEYANKSGYPKFLAGGRNLLAQINVKLHHELGSGRLESISLDFRGGDGAPISFDKPEYKTQLKKKYNDKEIKVQQSEKILRDFRYAFLKKAEEYMSMSEDKL